MRLMVDRSPRGGDGGNEAVKPVLQPLEGADLLHSADDAPARLIPDAPKPGLPSLSLHVALTSGVNAHRLAIMRPSPSRTIAMAASRLRFKVLRPLPRGQPTLPLRLHEHQTKTDRIKLFRTPDTRQEHRETFLARLSSVSLTTVLRLIVGNPEADSK